MPIIFQIIYLLIRLNQQKNTLDLICILENLRAKNSTLLGPLISSLTALRSFDKDISIDGEIEHLKKISKEDFEKIYWQNKSYFKLFSLKIEAIGKKIPPEDTLIGFQELMEDHPFLGCMLLAEGLIAVLSLMKYKSKLS